MRFDLPALIRAPRLPVRGGNWLFLPFLIAAAALAALVVSDWSPWSVPSAMKLQPLPSAPLVPVVEPVRNLDVTPDRARRINALVPLAAVPNPAAKPFRFAGAAQDAAGAQACLAAAAYYEAGNDPLGQAAVIQVILNRARHPAFPHSICGVVLQGVERVTGCQFSFTCDGSLKRRSPSPAALSLARATANLAMNGSVFAMAGNATHYHADYVVPQWSGAMDKLLAFHGHLFFRWRGPAGDARNFTGRYAGGESPGMLARFVAATALGQPDGGAVAADGAPPTAMSATATVPSGGVVRSDDWRGIYYAYFSPADYPGHFAVRAVEICASRKTCSVYGWGAVAQVPVAVTEARPAQILFIYSKAPGRADMVQWDCQRMARDNPRQCLPGTASIQEKAATSVDPVPKK
ncbi:cell wall hydrolase SleB [Sphingobium chlorophenolicum L-1]|uniref:Cell wall hydrolase SleB n=1 Tax=Sphingobium chlorophenolicum L-1 TaxID=690566 RepID=F6EX07_SPHCR|nr:cell wall hydrolase [Sphingobium chlorophenolicum]AEG48170.1 cell wall hydrolase SleB [Sphingobium chlorophenolicum L-1]